MYKINISFILFLMFAFVISASMGASAAPPFETPPKGGLPACQEELNMCTDDLSTCDEAIEEVQDELTACEFQLYKKVFVTSDTFDADLGGTAGADAICATAAARAGLSGTYKAWISDESSSPDTTFVKSTFPYILPDGLNTKIADDWTDLTTCDEGPGGTDCLDHPINVDENGNTVEGVTPATVWSNTLTDGTVDETDAIMTCDSFTRDVGSSALVGSFEAVDSFWTDAFLSLSCNLEARLYCFGQ